MLDPTSLTVFPPPQGTKRKRAPAGPPTRTSDRIKEKAMKKAAVSLANDGTSGTPVPPPNTVANVAGDSGALKATMQTSASGGEPQTNSSDASRAVTRQMRDSTGTGQISKPQPAEEEFTVSKENLPASGPATSTGIAQNLSPGRRVTSGHRPANPLNPTQENSTAEASRPPQGVDETKEPSLKKKLKVFLAVYSEGGRRVLVDVSK